MLWRLCVWTKGPSSNRARPLPNLPAMKSVSFLQVYYTIPNEVAGYDVACQVGKAYNIFPPVSWSFLEGLNAVKKSRPFFKFELVFLGNHGVINDMGVFCPQCLCHYVMRASEPVFSILNATVA